MGLRPGFEPHLKLWLHLMRFPGERKLEVVLGVKYRPLGPERREDFLKIRRSRKKHLIALTQLSM